MNTVANIKNNKENYSSVKIKCSISYVHKSCQEICIIIIIIIIIITIILTYSME